MAASLDLLRMWEIWKIRTRDERPFREIAERLLVSASYARTLFKRIDDAILQEGEEESPLRIKLRDGRQGKIKKTKKLKMMEIGGLVLPVVSCWEEEQQARAAGFESFYLAENKKRKRKSKSKRRFVLSDGSIFQCF